LYDPKTPHGRRLERQRASLLGRNLLKIALPLRPERRGARGGITCAKIRKEILNDPTLFRFVVGGLIVSLFATLGDVLKPKSFAGLFGAAPSVALATLGLTIAADGKLYAATEARSMIAGAFAFFVYAAFCSRLMMKNQIHSTLASITALALWLTCALGVWAIVLR
jgi:hypothetical protein